MLRVQLQNLSKSFENLSVLRNLTADLPEGSFTTVVGPSGGGKSTLLRLLAGLESATSGSVSLSIEQPRIGCVFQEPRLLPWKTLAENVSLPLELSRKSFSNNQIQEALEKVRLEKSAHLFPHQLSGGMKMRASLARALVVHPQLLLLDEAFAALDEKIRFELQEDLYRLWQQDGMTVLFVTHSLSEALFLSEKILILDSACDGFKKVFDLKDRFPDLRPSEFRTSTVLNATLQELTQALR